MSDLTAIVEAAMQAELNATCPEALDRGDDRDCICPDAGVLSDLARVSVQATLKAALTPLADEAETWAKHCDEQGDRALAADKDKAAARAYSARDTHNSYAKKLRELSQGKS